ncbi:hypothetical protein OIU84_026771 [Salix udensis]|uniref:Pentatricopeptide repeat-containing protein n=1 Tax=Salix udensis TaxID=889485 RepID=A0AAD6PEK3_9ROSI|nr:hypothetical protein OIU84_026771 [Salix udensis]
MLDVYAKAEFFNKARGLFMMVRKRGLVDVLSYNAIVAACVHNKDFKNMASAKHSMQSDGFSFSLEAHNCTLDAYGTGHMESFRNFFQRMKKSGCAADHYTYSIMMNIYGEQESIDEVACVLTELRECGH